MRRGKRVSDSSTARLSWCIKNVTHIENLIQKRQRPQDCYHTPINSHTDVGKGRYSFTLQYYRIKTYLRTKAKRPDSQFGHLTRTKLLNLFESSTASSSSHHTLDPPGQFTAQKASHADARPHLSHTNAKMELAGTTSWQKPHRTHNRNVACSLFVADRATRARE